MSVEADLVEAMVASTERFPRMTKKEILRMREDMVHPTMRAIIPKGVRLDVPMLNAFLLRETGNIIAGLGQRLMAVSHAKHLDEEHRLSQAVFLVREAQGRILFLRGGKSVTQKILEEATAQDVDSSE